MIKASIYLIIHYSILIVNYPDIFHLYKYTKLAIKRLTRVCQVCIGKHIENHIKVKRMMENFHARCDKSWILLKFSKKMICFYAFSFFLSFFLSLPCTPFFYIEAYVRSFIRSRHILHGIEFIMFQPFSAFEIVYNIMLYLYVVKRKISRLFKNVCLHKSIQKAASTHTHKSIYYPTLLEQSLMFELKIWWVWR